MNNLTLLPKKMIIRLMKTFLHKCHHRKLNLTNFRLIGYQWKLRIFQSRVRRSIWILGEIFNVSMKN